MVKGKWWPVLFSSTAFVAIVASSIAAFQATTGLAKDYQASVDYAVTVQVSRITATIAAKRATIHATILTSRLMPDVRMPIVASTKAPASDAPVAQAPDETSIAPTVVYAQTVEIPVTYMPTSEPVEARVIEFAPVATAMPTATQTVEPMPSPVPFPVLQPTPYVIEITPVATAMPEPTKFEPTISPIDSPLDVPKKSEQLFTVSPIP